MLGHLNALILNVWTIGGSFSNISIRDSFCAFFSRLCHASLKVYVQMNYLLSRNNPSEEVAVLKKYPDKSPINQSVNQSINQSINQSEFIRINK